MFSAVFHVAFFTLLCISEYTYTRNIAPALLFQDVTINETHIGLCIKGLKKKQANRIGVLSYRLRYQILNPSHYSSTCVNFCQLGHKYKAFSCHLNHKSLIKYQLASILLYK